MFGRSKETRIYTESDVMQVGLDWLNHGIKPPRKIATIEPIDEYHNRVTLISREDLKTYNSSVEFVRAKVVFEAPKPRFTLGERIKSIALAAITTMPAK